jgi:cold shock CspA family protein
MSFSTKPVSARELAQRVLLHPRGGVKALIQLVKESETEWLELKAATHPKNGVFGKGENADDYYWNVAKAVIALANSVGGVVLLGVTDDGSVIGIDASDPEGRRQTKGAEAFRREVVMQKMLMPPKGWKTERKGTFQLANAAVLNRLVTLEEIPHGDKSVLAIFVDPTEDYGFVEIESTQSVGQIIYARTRGAVGQVVELSVDRVDVLSTHERQRRKRSTEIGLLWKSFEESGRLARSSDELIPDVRRYVTALMMQQATASIRFVPLDAVERVEMDDRRRRASDDGDNWARSDAQSEIGSHDLLISKPALRKGAATELLRQSTRAVLIGEGGSGKSRCLAAFALVEARDWQPGRPWPLLVSLASYTGEGLAILLSRECGIDWQDLLPLIEFGQLTLCLDGLNECPDMYYDQCLAEIANILREYPTARVLVTSRTSQIPSGLGLEKFELEPMRREQQSQFLEAYLAQPQKGEFILAQMHLHPEGRMLAGSPLLLRIAAEVARENDEIPNKRSALYSRFLDAWFQREVDNARRSSEVLPWDFALAISALAELAFQARLKGSGRISLSQALSLLTHRLGEQTERFIDWASQGTVLVRNDAHEDLQFEHETIQEYLCAEYLVMRHEDLHSEVLVRRADAKRDIWAMPLAFAFEMLDQPSPSFLDAAWKVEPLIVATRVGDIGNHRAKEVDGDLWLQAVLKILLGEDPAEQVRDIAIISRLPRKYPISPYLLASLNSRAFWYSAQTHDVGTTKVEHLRDLICGTDFPWIELLEDALIGCRSVSDGLSPSQRAITGSSPSPTIAEVLSSASVSELCALRRRKLISANIFLNSWKAALDRSPKAREELDLLDIIRTEKEQGTEILRGMLPRYQAQLSKIAFEPKLSLRLLNILLRGGVVSVEEVRKRPGFLENVCSRMSMMNAIRLTKTRLLRRSDINDETRSRLIFDRNTNPHKIQEAIRLGLLEPEDLPLQLRSKLAFAAPRPRNARLAGSREKRFSTSRLSDPRSRNKVNAELANQRWEVVLKRVPQGQGFGFVQHPDFEGDIFCLLSRIASPGHNQLHNGQKLDVRITTSYDDKKARWSYSVESGRTA